MRTPLLSSRRFYMDKTTDALVLNPATQKRTLTMESIKLPPATALLPSHRDIAESVKIAFEVQGSKGPMIVGRIIRKSTILNWGKSPGEQTRSRDGFPLVFQLTVCDVMGNQATQVPISVWNSLVCDYFELLQVGMIVAVIGWRAKLKLDHENPNLSNGGVELAMNPNKGEVQDAHFQIVTPENMDWKQEFVDARFPFPQLRDVTIKQIRESVRDETEVDLIGKIVWVGRLEKERVVSENFPRGQVGSYAEYRWIMVGDSSTNHAIPVKLYVGISGGFTAKDGSIVVGGEASIVRKKVEPGMKVLLTNMNVGSPPFFGGERHVALYSSRTSQVFTWTQAIPEEFWFHRVIGEDVVDTKISGVVGELMGASAGPNVAAPSFTILKNTMTDEIGTFNSKRLAVSDLPSVAKNLAMDERFDVVVEGTLMEVCIQGVADATFVWKAEAYVSLQGC
jgi:hypothetical protein